MQVRKNLSAFLATLTAGGALALGGLALPQTAAAGNGSDCHGGQPCFWRNSNRDGWVFNGFANYVGDTYNDHASSFQNNTGINVIWHWDAGCRGNIAMILSPGQWQNASWWNNDETSSVCSY